MQPNDPGNHLHYGDNLAVLRQHWESDEPVRISRLVEPAYQVRQALPARTMGIPSLQPKAF